MGYKPVPDKAKNDGDRKGEDDDGRYKIDDVLEYFGSIGKFQIIINTVQCLVTFTAGWRILFDLFAAKYVPWSCTDDGLEIGCSDAGPKDVGKRPCEVGDNSRLEDNLTGSAVGRYWEYDANQTSHSIVSTFDHLRCEEDWKFTFISSIYFVGAFFGVWMFGRLSDMIGRRKSLLISLVMCVAQAWVIPFFNDMNVYLTCRFFDGMAFGGYVLIGYVLTVEYSPPKLRNKVSTPMHIAVSVGQAILAGFAYVFKVWRWYAIGQAVLPTVTLIASFFLMPESIRYLLSSGKEKEALALLQKVADTNGNKMPEPCSLYKDADVKVNLLDVLKHKKLMMCAPINMFGWFTCSLVSYMLWFSARYLAGDKYLNVALLAAVSLPGKLIALFAIDRVGRKKTFMIAMVLASVCMFVSIWDNPYCRKVMFCLGKMFSSTLWVVIYLYSSEMYPNKIRNFGSGIGSASARVAALLAPFVGKLFVVSAILPYILVGALTFACCGVFWILPETKDRDLPQNLAEFENLFKPPIKKKRDKPEVLQC